MPLNTNKAAGGGPQIAPLDSGAYPGRVLSVIDLGLQPQRPYEGQDKPPAEEIMISYEFSDEFIPGEDGEDDESKPRVISERFVVYNLNSDKAKSTARYKAIDPTISKGGDFTNLPGMPVNITVVQNPGKNGKVYENIAGLTPMRAKEVEKLPDLANPARVFDLGAPDLEIFKALYPWQQGIVVSNLNYEGSSLQQMLEDDPEYDAPDTSAPAQEKDTPTEDNPF